MPNSITRLSKDHTVPTTALFHFIALTLAISWGLAAAYLFLPGPMNAIFGELVGAHPLYFLMTWGPGISGIVIVLKYGGTSGLRAFMSRVFVWRVDAAWWALVLLVTPLIFMIGSLVKGGPILAPMEYGVGQVAVVALVMLFLGPVEEFGWRGLAQPILQRHVAPFWAGAIIGLVWGIWHLPAFFLSGTVYADWNFPLFLFSCMILAILVTAVFNNGRGGLLLPILFHWQLIMPFWPDAQPWDTWIFAVLTAAIVWIKRAEMFSSTGSVTTVIPAKRPAHAAPRTAA